jgi:uncharacterized protein YjbI with pentapeptide repeats
MANPEHLEMLKQGVAVWNKWRAEHLEITPDFSRKDFTQVDFSPFINFSDAYLRGTNFRGANLKGADFRRASLSRTDLAQANLKTAHLDFANLYHANITGADLRSSELTGTIFNRVNFLEAKFSGAKLGWTIFADCDLSRAVGLNSVIHSGPSTIGFDTVYLSRKKIPEVFFRGCGLSDWEIENAKLYNPDLSNEEINDIQYRIHELRVKRAFQINPLFISYSHNNSDFVDAIEPYFINEGIRLWRDIHDAKSGRLEKQIDAAIHANDVVLLVLSEHSVKSDWVEHEVRKAREKEKQTGKDTLCPVALNDSWKTCHWPERLLEQILEYNILDFSNWKVTPTFQKQFRKLVEGLNLFYQ